jgi:hypothetical protein
MGCRRGTLGGKRREGEREGGGRGRTLRFLSSAFETSLLMRARFLMRLALLPKRIVETVSASLLRAGEQLIMSAVRQFPPIASCRICGRRCMFQRRVR